MPLRVAWDAGVSAPAAHPVEKNQYDELVVPTEWRETIADIVSAFTKGNYSLDGIDAARLGSHLTADDIRWNIEQYGDVLIDLPAEAWDTSVYLWMGEHWDVLVDLFVLGEEGRSDLVLFVRVFEGVKSYSYVVYSVHVP